MIDAALAVSGLLLAPAVYAVVFHRARSGMRWGVAALVAGLVLLGWIGGVLLGHSLGATAADRVKLLTDCATAGAALAAVLAAFRGLRTWEHQLKGTDQYELAKRLYVLAHRVETTLNGVVWILDHGAMSMELAYDRNSAAYREAMEALRSESLVAQAFWGQGITDAIEALDWLEADVSLQGFDIFEKDGDERHEVAERLKARGAEVLGWIREICREHVRK